MDQETAAAEHTGGGNNRGARRRFGSVRKLSSGRFQARYTGPDGKAGPTAGPTDDCPIVAEFADMPPVWKSGVPHATQVPMANAM